MMYERFTPDARSVVAGATEHARRLGHRYVGGEHLLLAVAGAGQPAGAVLSAHGVTPERVEEEIIRRVGTGAGAGLFAGVDAEALAAIGIDLDAVRARIEASFGPQALTQAARALNRGAAGPGRSRRGWPPGWAWRAMPRRATRRRATRRRARRGRGLASGHGPAGMVDPRQAHGRFPAAALPYTAVAKKILEVAFREALALTDSQIGTEHVALAIISARRGLVPDILSAVGASPAALRTGVVNRYRQAS
jgi:ATP-dependent Clp protease ATP-binding subunit ClpA